MKIKQKSFISIGVIFVSFLVILGVNYYTGKIIKDKEKELLLAQKGISDAEKAILKHYKFVVNFLRAYLQNKKADLTTDPNKCALAKFLHKHKSNLTPKLQVELKKVIPYHNDLHYLVKLYNSKFVRYDRDIHEKTYKAFMEKYIWLLKVANFALVEKVNLSNSLTNCSVFKYLSKYKNNYFTKLGYPKLDEIYKKKNGYFITQKSFYFISLAKK